MKIKYSGPLDAEVVVVGDQPTTEDADTGYAFSGTQGELVKGVLSNAGFDFSKVLFTGCIDYKRYVKSAMTPNALLESRANYLTPLITAHPRKLVIVLGNSALFATGASETIAGINAVRGTLTSSTEFEYPVVPSIHPFFVMQDPDEVEDFYADLKYAYRMYLGDRTTQAPMKIVDLETPESVDDLLKRAKGKILSYDFETTDLNRDTAKVVSVSLCMGEVENGEYVVYFWGGYDMLEPRFDAATLEEFRLAFDRLFSAASTDYGLVGWNTSYDDWIAERYVGHELPGSTFDAMFMKWCVNNGGRHGLKDATARYLGYPDYEKEAHEHVKEVKARRGRVLTDETDLNILKSMGVEPELSARGLSKWPKSVDKGWGAFALIPYPILRLYNCLDALYTKLLFDLLSDKINKDKLGKSCNLRHNIGRELMRCEQRGLLLDVETNRAYSTELGEIIEACSTKIQEYVKGIAPNLEDFKPTSNAQLGRILYGDPIQVPTANRELVAQGLRWKDKQDLYARIDKFDNKFYGNYTDVKEAYSTESFDYEDCANRYAKRFVGVFPEYSTIDVTHERGEVETLIVTGENLCVPKNVYPYGLYSPIAFTKGGAPSCAGVVLQTLYEKKPNDFLKLVLMHRKAGKLKSTFIDSVYNSRYADNSVHPRMNTIGTTTGRASSSHFNAQNLPKYIRGQFIPRPGYVFLEFDYSQAEVRAVAAYSQDKKLLTALDEGDIHTNVARLIFKTQDITPEQRRWAKTVVFGIIYGLGGEKLAIALGITQEEAEDFIEEFFNTFPDLKNWLDNQIKIAEKAPYYVYTPWGTRRSTKGMLSTDKGIRGHTARIAANMPIQGAAGELTLYAITLIMKKARELGYDVHTVNTTHDSVTLEVPKHLAYRINETEDGKYDCAGPMVDLVREVIATPAPVFPLNTVQFKADLEINYHWSAKPNLKKAIDPREDLFNWALIKPEEVLTVEEQAELRDLEALHNNDPIN